MNPVYELSQFLVAAMLLGGTRAATPYAELKSVETNDSSASVEHDHFMPCAGDLYFSMTSVDSADDSIDGLYRFDDDKSKRLVSSVGKVRGLTCHHKHLYYYKRESSTPWGLYAYDLQKDEESFISDASNYSHEPLVNYEGQLFIGGRGPKLYKLILSTDKLTVGAVWEAPSKHDDKLYPQSLAVHKGEQGSDLYFMAPNKNGRRSLWKFNVANDEATVLKDLVLRTGDDKATIAEMISYKGPQDFQPKLYFSLGGFEKADGHHRLATWEPSGAGSLPVETLVKHYDPSHLTVFQDDLYMVLRNPKDLSKFAVWDWNGRFVKEVFHLPNEARISSVEVWDDILVVTGDSGPMVVWNGDIVASVSDTTKLSGISGMVAHKGDLLIAATEDPADKGNKLWRLNKGIWKNPHSESGSNTDKNGGNKSGSSGSSGSGSGSDGVGAGVDNDNTASLGANSGDDRDTSGNNAAPPTWTREVSGSGMGGGAKFFIVVLVLGIVGGLGWYAYKNSPYRGDKAYDSGSKKTWTRDEGRSGERSDGGFMA